MPDIQAQTPDGVIHNFPDGTSQDAMDNAIRAYLKVPSTQTVQAAKTEQAPVAKGDTRPSTRDVFNQSIVQPALQVGQQTMEGIKDVPKALIPHFSQDDLQKGKDLVSSLPLVGRGDPGPIGAYAGAALRQAGRLTGDALNIVSSPFNLATASISEHIQKVVQPWQELAKRMYGKDSSPDPATGRYTTGNSDVDKTIDNVVGSIPFAMTGEAFKKGNEPTPLVRDLEGIRAQPKAKNSTSLGPISEASQPKTQIDMAAKAPVEAHAPAETSGASKSAGVENVIAPDFTGKESPIPRYKFPGDKNIPTGGTIGLDKVDPFKPVAKDPIEVAQAPKPVVINVPGLVSQLHKNFDRIADLSRQKDFAETDDLNAQLEQEQAKHEQSVRSTVQQGLSTWDSKSVGEFRDQAAKEAVQLDAQAKAIKDLTEATIKNRGVKNQIADLRSEGGQIRKAVVNQETGEQGVIKPEDRVSRGGRAIFDELQGRKPTSEFNSLQVMGKPEGVSDEEWESHVNKLQEERQGLKKTITETVLDAANRGKSISELGIEGHVDRLKEIEGLLGKYTETTEGGRRPNVKPSLDENGAIEAKEPLKSWTLERARLALGKKLKEKPSMEEFFQHAEMRREKARLFRDAADIASQVLKEKSQRGAIGEVSLKGKVEPVRLENVTADDFLDRVKKLGRVERDREGNPVVKKGKTNLDITKVTGETETAPAGFLVVDSHGQTHLIDNRTDQYEWGERDTLMHDELAEAAYPQLKDFRTQRALNTILENGNIVRKARPGLYEAHDLSNRKVVSAIELDAIKDGMTNKIMEIDTRKPDGRVASLTLSPNWDNLSDAIADAKRRQGWSASAGATKGVTLLSGATVGSVVGSVAGVHFGHPLEGGVIGWGLGFMSTAIAQHPVMLRTINALGPSLRGFGISMHDWLIGPKQLDPVNTDMKPILDAQQRDIKGPTRSVLTRVAQLPADIAHKFDQFSFVNDRPTAVGKFLMQFDDRGRAFRNLRGKLDVENSPYVSAWIAAGGGGGMGEAHLLDYKKMYKEAQSKGLVNNVNEYLNLKGYQRVYDVMQERIQDTTQSINKLTQALQQPKLPVEVEAGMRKALREAKEERQDVIDKLTSKTLVPKPYDPPKIAKDLQTLQAQLGSKFQDVQQLAGRVFDLNRKVLDMVHGAGIIGDAEYQKYIGRGNEYIPMHRILEPMMENNGRISGTGPGSLYLRQQNVIKALMGSDRINRDPVVASADANLAAIKEVLRNGVIKDYLKIAAADPQGVGSYFKKVKSGYKAGPDEGLVGVYIDGQQHTFAAPSWLAESLKSASPNTITQTGKVMTAFSQILRKGATMGNLAWSVPNALRHFGDMALMSEAGLKSIKTLPRDAAGLVRDWSKSVYGAITHDQVWQEYMRSGSAYSTLQRAISPEDSLSLDTLGFKQKIAHGRVIDVVQDFNAAVEDATKMTTYRRLRQAGYTEKAAAWETRRYGGGPDFAKHGTMSPAINLASMFFNAHLQYVSRVFAKAAENPARVAVALGAITAMAMTLNEHNYQQKDDKGNQLIRKVPYTDRENNFVVLTGDTYQASSGATLPVYLKVPKPSFVKFLYNPIENMLNKVAGNEDRSGTQLGLQALGNLSPGQMDLQEGQVGKSAARGVVSSLNPVIKTPLEEAMNYKTTGTGGPIVPGREVNIDSRFQYGSGTSETAKRIGEGGLRGSVAGAAEGGTIGYLLAGPKGAAVGGALGSITGSFGISPRRAEHVIDSTTAGVGRIATGFVDPFLGGVKQTKMEGPEKLSNYPGIGPVAARFVSTSIDQQEQNLTNEFYTSAQKAQEPMNTLNFLKKNHPEQVLPYIDAHKNDLWKGTVATQMQNRLGQILNAQKEVEQNASMKPEDKAKTLKTLHDVKMQVLGVFTKVMKPSPQKGQVTALPGQGQGNATR